MQCPCACNSGGFSGGCGHAGCSGGINVSRPRPSPVHRSRGRIVGREGIPYGQTHDMDCPGCADTPSLLSPRSDTYWSP